MDTQVVEVRRDDIGATRVVDESLGELVEGRVRFRVDRFAVTANTTSYAEFGDLLDYWGFWPSGDDEWGRVPAIGWATVVESHEPDIAIGGRHFGWFPMAGHVDVTVTATGTGCRDIGAHRSAHAPVYRDFVRTDLDPLHPARAGVAADGLTDAEDRHALLRGLFLTGYLADGFFDAHGWFGARHVVVLSASSKTAIGFADRAGRHEHLRLVGVTSPRNVELVTSLGSYDDVVTYADVAAAVPDDGEPAVVVDMAGNGPALEAVHAALGDRLAHSMIVGRTHHDAPPPAPSTGPQPEMFFAPTALGAMAERGVDAAAFQAGMGAALTDFVERSHDWLAVEHAAGPDGVVATWADVLAGRVAPSVGRVATVHPS